MATVVHFNVHADQIDRAKSFYEQAFGWKFTALPEPMNYYLIETTGANGQKGIGGGLTKRETPHMPGFLNFFGVKSIDEMINKIKELGGSVVTPKQVIPNWGYMAVCTDTENNLFGLFQEDAAAH